eukprot:8168708-Lingulodinium_polyedra.AAC.1
MARRRGGGGGGGNGGNSRGGGSRGGGSRAPSGQQLSAAERRLESMIQWRSNQFSALADRVDGLVGA